MAETGRTGSRLLSRTRALCRRACHSRARGAGFDPIAPAYRDARFKIQDSRFPNARFPTPPKQFQIPGARMRLRSMRGPVWAQVPGALEKPGKDVSAPAGSSLCPRGCRPPLADRAQVGRLDRTGRGRVDRRRTEGRLVVASSQGRRATRRTRCHHGRHRSGLRARACRRLRTPAHLQLDRHRNRIARQPDAHSHDSGVSISSLPRRSRPSSGAGTP